MVSFWVGFHLLIFLLLAIDLGVFRKGANEISAARSYVLTGYWVALALLFNGFVYWFFGKEAALEFFTGFLLEKSLSVDNLFVFLMLFTYFQIPASSQHRVLFWGVLGAIILRMTLILVGVYLIAKFSWMMYLLGAFLCVSGIKFAMQQEKELQPEQNWLMRWCQKHLPYESQVDGTHFFVRRNGRWKITPLFLVLVLIESTDLVFALDSIPAIFSITTNPFIVYTSNIFAILGLRSLYFALEASLNRLIYFKWGLSAILIFVGLKMLFSGLIIIPIWISLMVIFLILAITIFASLSKK